MENKRIVMLDNLRAILIVLVVFGHVLERLSFRGGACLYQAIYSLS